MPALIDSVRIAAEFPTPRCLADYESFQSLAPGQFGLSVQVHVGPDTLERIQQHCRQGYDTEQSLGYCVFARPKAIFFDMDSTVIREESVVELARIAGKNEEVERVTEAAMAGKLDFEQSLRERVALLAGVSLLDVERVASQLTLNPGIQAFIGFCREVGVPTFLVSGGFHSLADVVQRKVGFSGVHANRLADDGVALTGELVSTIVDAERKLTYVKECCAELGIDPLQVAAVGDGANDLPMLRGVGCAIGFRPKEILKNEIHAIINSVGHKFLGPLLFGRDLTMTRERLNY